MLTAQGEVAMKNTARMILALVAFQFAASWLAGCGASRQDVSKAEGADGLSKDAVEKKTKLNPARLFTSQVDEKNLLLDNKKAAKDYLRGKLVGLLVQDLTKLGIDAQQATSLAANGSLDEFKVNGHREKIPGKGADAGKTTVKVIFDVKGLLNVRLSDQDVAGLGNFLDSLPLNSIEGAKIVSGYLDSLKKLGPEKEQLIALEKKVGDRWAALLEPFLKVQLEVSVEKTQEFRKALTKSAEALIAFAVPHGKHTAFAKLEKIFTLAALRWLKMIEVKAQNHPQITARLKELDDLTKGKLPNLSGYLRRDLELAWRNRMNELEKKEIPFPEIKPDFLLFMEDFPRSDFYPELELRFLVRWVDYLQARKVKDLDDLKAFIQEVALLRARFPNFGQMEDVNQALAAECVSLFTKIEIPDLDRMKQVRKVLMLCDPVLKAGMETMAVRKRLDEIDDHLMRKRDDRLERKALKSLTFFVEWDKAINGLKFGNAAAGWEGKDHFFNKWKTGRDAAEDCRCTLDPDEPCKVFEEDSSHGGFEVVARFYKDKLSGVDLCQVYAGTNLSAIYRFFIRRYKKAHSNRQAAVFLSGAGGEVKFGKISKRIVYLSCSSGSCSVKYRHGPALAAMQEQERQERLERQQIKEKARKARIKKGWSKHDCVKWECDPECLFEGNVITSKKGRYQITVRRADEDPRAVGNHVWVAQEELFDCQ
jgi:hypothetical protein